MDFGSISGLSARMAQVQSPTKTNRAQPTTPSAPADAVKLEVSSTSNDIPSSPPDEVLDAMGTASAAHDQLAASGRGLSFRIDDATGKVVVTVHDTQGNVLFTVPASKALDIASGGSLD